MPFFVSHSLLLGLAFLARHISGYESVLQDQQNKLYEFLFSRPSSKWLNTFPICDNLRNTSNMTLDQYKLSINSTSLLTTGVLIYFNQIAGLDEKRQSISAKFSFVMKWEDCRLAWPAERFAGINAIGMSTRDVSIFIPKLSLEERLEEDIIWSESAINLQSNGVITLQKSETLLFGCEMDVGMYPFDSQHCQITLRSRVFALDKLNVTTINTGGSEIGHLDNFIQSDTWTLREAHCQSSFYALEVDTGALLGIEARTRAGTKGGVMKAVKILKPFSQIVFSFTLQRQPFYEVMNLLLPAVVTVVISGCVFFIPPRAGDKVNLSLTILLGMFVFTQLIYDKMPERGSQLPLLSQYFLLSIAMICASCLVAVLTTNMSARQETCMHQWVHRLFLVLIGPRIRPDLFRDQAQQHAHHKKLRSWLAGRKRIKVPSIATTVAVNLANVSDEVIEPAESHPGKDDNNDLMKKGVSKTMQDKWILLAQVIDRLFLIVHLLTTTLLFLRFTITGVVHMS